MPIYFRRFLCPLRAAAVSPSARAYAASPDGRTDFIAFFAFGPCTYGKSTFVQKKGQHADNKESRNRSPVRKYAGLPAPALVRRSTFVQKDRRDIPLPYAKDRRKIPLPSAYERTAEQVY